MKQLRILMADADATPGTGTSPPAPVQPADPQAQGGTAPTIDAKSLAQQVENSVHAALRRLGVTGQKSKTTDEAPAGAGQQPDYGKLRALDRALTLSPYAGTLTDAAYARMERDFLAEAPPDAKAWLKDYVESFGVRAPAAAPAAASPAASPQPRSAVPVSDGGSPTAPQVPLEERQMLKLTPEERDHVLKTKGVRWYLDKLKEQTRGGVVRLSR
jgi:hypothetical protein